MTFHYCLGCYRYSRRSAELPATSRSDCLQYLSVPPAKVGSGCLALPVGSRLVRSSFQCRASVSPSHSRCSLVAEAPAHVAHTTRQAASAGGAPRPAGAAKCKASTSRSSSLSGRVSKRSSLPNSRIPKFQLIQVIFPLSLCNSHAVTTYERIICFENK